jgi:hypothetical protein
MRVCSPTQRLLAGNPLVEAALMPSTFGALSMVKLEDGFRSGGEGSRRARGPMARFAEKLEQQHSRTGRAPPNAGSKVSEHFTVPAKQP